MATCAATDAVSDFTLGISLSMVALAQTEQVQSEVVQGKLSSESCCISASRYISTAATGESMAVVEIMPPSMAKAAISAMKDNMLNRLLDIMLHRLENLW